MTNTLTNNNNTQGCCGNITAGQEACSPANWGFWSADAFKACNPYLDPVSGKMVNQQTPINLDISEKNYEARSKLEGRIVLMGGNCVGHVVYRSAVWEIEFLEFCESAHLVIVDGQEWRLWQMHIHGPSEHTVNGMYYPLEVHMVHIPNGATLATVNRALVLGIFLTPGPSNKIFDILTTQPALVDASSPEGRKVNQPFDPYKLIPKDRSYYHYTGSLTTPNLGGAQGGCQLNADSTKVPNPFDAKINNIKWYVFKKPVTISIGQLAWVTDYFCEAIPLAWLCTNHRPIQPVLNSTQMYTYGKKLYK